MIFLKSICFAPILIFPLGLKCQNPLFIPPVLNGTTFNLTVQPGTTQFFPGINTPTFGVNGNLLGPTLILNKWDAVTLNVTNNLSTTTTMHWHGLHVPAKADGGPHQIIMPGTTWSPSFTVLNDAATYWYHPHGENQTNLQVSKGIAGLIIVKDSSENALNLPRNYGSDDFPLIIQTRAFDGLNQIAIATVFDTVPMVNGVVNAGVSMPAQVVRMRLLNGASERVFYLGFSNNMSFWQIAGDAGLLLQPIQYNRLQLANGERAEILVDFTSMQGQMIYLQSFGSELPDGIIGAENVGTGMAQITDYDLNPLNGGDFNLLHITINAPTANPVTVVPASLVSQNPWNPANANITRSISMDVLQMCPPCMVEGPFGMNGVQFDMNTVNITTYKNSLEVWTINNLTMVAHPFHLHNMHFFITGINGIPLPPSLQSKKDVALVMPQQSLSFVTQFLDFTDTIPYMFHCHNLHHEDEG